MLYLYKLKYRLGRRLKQVVKNKANSGQPEDAKPRILSEAERPNENPDEFRGEISCKA